MRFIKTRQSLKKGDTKRAPYTPDTQQYEQRHVDENMPHAAVQVSHINTHTHTLAQNCFSNYCNGMYPACKSKQVTWLKRTRLQH